MDCYQSEKYIERKLVAHVKGIGGMCLKLLPFQMNGLPDRICLLPMGRVLFVETKSKGDRPSKIQKVVHGKLTKIGFPVMIVDNVEKIEKIC